MVLHTKMCIEPKIIWFVAMSVCWTYACISSAWTRPHKTCLLCVLSERILLITVLLYYDDFWFTLWENITNYSPNDDFWFTFRENITNYSPIMTTFDTFVLKRHLFLYWSYDLFYSRCLWTELEPAKRRKPNDPGWWMLILPEASFQSLSTPQKRGINSNEFTISLKLWYHIISNSSKV